MSHRSPLPWPLADAPFTVADARAGGVPRSRLRSSDLKTPFRGVRVRAGGIETFVDRCHACQARMHPDQFFSHLTAARLFGLPTPQRTDADLLDVCSVPPRQRMRTTGVRGHELVLSPQQRVHRVGELRALDAVSTWIQLASQLTERELVVMGDALVQRQRPFASLEQLRHRVALNAGRRGHRRLVQALALVREGTDSPRESELRLDLVAAGLPEPTVNPAIRDADGRFLGFGDLVYAEQKVVVEYDGQQHRTSDRQFGHDVTRLNALGEDGWIVIRVTKEHWATRHAVAIPQVRRALLTRGWRPR